jgi:hypothetical protein
MVRGRVVGFRRASRASWWTVLHCPPVALASALGAHASRSHAHGRARRPLTAGSPVPWRTIACEISRVCEEATERRARERRRSCAAGGECVSAAPRSHPCLRSALPRCGQRWPTAPTASADQTTHIGMPCAHKGGEGARAGMRCEGPSLVSRSRECNGARTARAQADGAGRGRAPRAAWRRGPRRRVRRACARARARTRSPARTQTARAASARRARAARAGAACA